MKVVNFSLALIISMVLLQSSVFAQGTSVNTTGNPPDPSAIFDVSSNNQGMLMPRMTTAERNAITNPVEGLIIFNTTTKCFNFFKNSMWFELCGNCVPPPAPVASNNGPICSVDTLKLFATTIPNATYSWTGPNGFTSSLQNPVILFADSTMNGTYSVTASIQGCTSTVATTLANVSTIPSAAFTFNPSPAVVNVATIFTPAVSGASYAWTFQSGNPAISAVQNPSVQWTATGSYTVGLTITRNGCTASSSQQVSVTNCYNHGQSLTFNYTGSTQSWTVPSGVCSISVDAYGAQGGDNPARTGGLGARIKGDFSVSAGQVITVIVGAKGQSGIAYSGYTGGGGGGGTGAVIGSTALVIAGGGGAAGHQNNGLPGLTGTSGGCGFNQGNPCFPGGSGGANGTNSNCADGGQGWNNGVPTNGLCRTQCGGYGLGGGGGASSTQDHGGGGGGGYSGGGAGWDGGAGGGGSINNGTNQTNTEGFQSGNGQLIISW
jgi:hypothetical protein